jgi:hypothetical protein
MVAGLEWSERRTERERLSLEAETRKETARSPPAARHPPTRPPLAHPPAARPRY